MSRSSDRGFPRAAEYFGSGSTSPHFSGCLGNTGTGRLSGAAVDGTLGGPACAQDRQLDNRDPAVNCHSGRLRHDEALSVSLPSVAVFIVRSTSMFDCSLCPCSARQQYPQWRSVRELDC